jgi:predicted lipoprotein
MMKHASKLTLSLCMALGIAAPAAAQMQSRDQMESQTQTQERIYGSELMTQQERAEYQNRMRAAKTEQEREAIRLEHHQKMQERAKAQGKTLPDTPPANRGPGMGPGGGGMMGPGGRGGY